MANTDRLLVCSWGVATRFSFQLHNNKKMQQSQGTKTEWSQCVDDFDAQKYCADLHSCGAGFCIFSLCSEDRFLVAPNYAFDKITGIRPGKASPERDLIMDLSDELQRYGIDLYLYMPSDGPCRDLRAARKFGFYRKKANNLMTVDYVRKWSAVIEEYSVRYGSRISGWWFDNCFKYEYNYTDRLLNYYYEAAKKGNPNTIVAMNGGINKVLVKNFNKEDYVAGQFDDFAHYPDSRYIDGAQAFVFSHLGTTWGYSGTRYDGKYMHDYVMKANALGAAVAVDVMVNRDGSIDSRQLEVLKGIDRYNYK